MPAQTPPFVDRRWTSPEGLNLHARDYAPAAGPARPPVVAIHGLTRNSADFEAIAPLLAQSGRRVLAVDVRGRGLSDRAPDPMTYTPDVYARDIRLEYAAVPEPDFVLGRTAVLERLLALDPLYSTASARHWTDAAHTNLAAERTHLLTQRRPLV